MMWARCCVWLMLSGCCAAIAATPVHSVLILPFENATSQPNLDVLARGMPDLLTVCLSQYPQRVVLVERAGLAAVTAELGLQTQGLTDPNIVPKVGRFLQAEYLLRGSLLSVDRDDLTVQILLMEVETTELVYAMTWQSSRAKIIRGLCEHVGLVMLQKMFKADLNDVSRPISQHPERQQLLIEGLGHYYQGDPSNASAAFLTLIRAHPTQGNAYFWLGLSFLDGGFTQLAQTQLERFLQRFPEHPKASHARQILHRIQVE